MSKRLIILQNSLAKKEAQFDSKIEAHFGSVRETNGQPLNDKRNGRATMDKWDRQNDSLRTLKDSIQKTKDAIEREEMAIAGVESQEIPTAISDLINNGTLTQWRKFPNRFFVVGVERARIVYHEKDKIIGHRYVNEIPDAAQHKKFAIVYNQLRASINDKTLKSEPQ